MTDKIIKGVVMICSFLIGLGILVELDQSNDMDILTSLFAIIFFTIANVKIFEQKKIL
jgi:hypothetical protein